MELKASFNGLNLAVFDILAKATAELANVLYKEEHRLIQMVDGEPPVFAVGINGPMNAGKSRFSKPFLTQGLSEDFEAQAQMMEKPISATSFGNIKIPVWRSSWCDTKQRENRVRDCILTGPYHLPSGEGYDMRGEVDCFTPHMPSRAFSGFEVLEHSGAVPKDKIGLKVQIGITEENQRNVSVILPSFSEDIMGVWDGFKRAYWEKASNQTSVCSTKIRQRL